MARAPKVTWPCEYCNAVGCHWTNHDDAVADVAIWQATARATANE